MKKRIHKLKKLSTEISLYHALIFLMLFILGFIQFFFFPADLEMDKAFLAPQHVWGGDTGSAFEGSLRGQWTYVFGADSLGRSLLERVFGAFFISWLLGLLAASLALFIGLIFGFWMGLQRGWVDQLWMRLIEVLDSLPSFMVLVLWILLWMGEGAVASTTALLWLVLGMGLIQWRQFARITRNEVIFESSKLYVEAARAIGVSRGRLVFCHLLPNIWPQVRVQFWLSLPSFIMAESVLSFLGFGLQPPQVSLGTLLQEGWAYFSLYPHLMLVPGLFLCGSLLIFQMIFKQPERRGSASASNS